MDRPAPLSRCRLALWATAVLLTAGAGPLRADDPAPAADRPAAAKAAVTMRHFNSPWPVVLQKLAEESGSNLVMKDVPPGRFSRFDRGAYTRDEAVKMLNQRLEPDGFRILEQGKNLIVISDRSVRQDYRRPTAPGAEGRPLHDPMTAQTPLPEPAERRRDFSSVIPHRDGEVRPAGRTAREAAAEYAAEQVQNAAHEEPMEPGAAPVFDLTAGEVAAAADAAAPVTVTVRVSRGNAKAVARALMLAVGDHAKLIDRGPGGHPAFAAYRPQEDGAPNLTGTPVYSVGMDETKDELIVTAPGARAEQIASVLTAIDRGPKDGQGMTVVAGGPETVAVSRQLRPVLATLARFRRQEGQAPDAAAPAGNAAAAQPPANPGDAAPPAGAGPGVADTGELQRILDNVRSDVQVEEFGNTGVLIIRGNRDDVAAVARVINQLEQLSAGLQPQIQLLFLRHVDSVPLSALLTEVYGELARLRNRGEEAPTRVTILPVGKPNAVIVIASEPDLEAVEALATQLDQPVPAGTQLEVFRLQHALAPQVAEAIEAFYAEREGLFPQVRLFADVRTNSLVVNAEPNGLAEVRKLVRDLDRGESGLVSRMEIVALEFATAEALADTINLAIRAVINPAQAQQGAGLGGGAAGGGADAQALQAARSVIVEYVTATGEVGRSGLLADVTVAPDPTGNRLILTAPEKTMPLLIALVAALDAPSGARADVKVFTLENADAETAVEILRELFDASATGGGAGTDAPAGVTLEGTTDAGSALVPLRFSADNRTQTVLAIGGTDALAIVEAVLLRLDSENRNRQRFFSVKLLNTPAIGVAQALSDLIVGRRTLLTQVPGFLAQGELIERDTVIIPETSSNRLLIFASDRSREEILRLIKEIDEAPPQVAIQVLLVEVDLQNTDEFGVELGFQDSVLFDRGITAAEDLLTVADTITSPNGVQTTTERVISQSTTPGFNFNNTAVPLGNNVAANPASTGIQGLNNFGFGRANAELGFGGFVLSASSANVSVLLRALAAKRSVHVLSRPQVTVLDQQLARIQVGQEVPVVDGVSITANSTIPTVTRQQSGLILQVTPRISPDGTVFMQIGVERSNFDLAGVPIFTDVATGAVITSPIKNVTITDTFASVPNGQTVVIGGIIVDSEAVDERKVPYLGDIPFLGQLFRTDSTVTSRSELLVFLTPRIIYTDADFELHKQVETDRLHFLEHEAEAIHGPLFGVAPSPGQGGYHPGLFGPPLDLPPGAAFEGGAIVPPSAIRRPSLPAPSPGGLDGEFCPVPTMPGAPHGPEPAPPAAYDPFMP
ncbi:secretin N-terminal domain-containing protein [Alienimonas californiensis]|uniref:Type II secretion system protein D n=1 Tax=Alienimonas californiensis TaxID=2527989 RepID=A0A517PDW9_9PLAN|nr:secretin N-terminal domain-containing protein [Alienimonas californiensis]QDT17572.1 Putative type II secretion system protein D precursor [Alienimonas californiensis]